MALLKTIKQDCTFNQSGNVKEFVKNNNKDFYSLDLESATDRLSSKLQERLLSKILRSEEAAHDYFKILNGQPFLAGDKYISYAVGQPMGAYSS
jgi:hypothetical protein